jgi:hypothetical protein
MRNTRGVSHGMGFVQDVLRWQLMEQPPGSPQPYRKRLFSARLLKLIGGRDGDHADD